MTNVISLIGTTYTVYCMTYALAIFMVNGYKLNQEYHQRVFITREHRQRNRFDSDLLFSKNFGEFHVSFQTISHNLS